MELLLVRLCCRLEGELRGLYGRERRSACWFEVERSSLDLLCMGCCAEKRRRGSGLWKG